MSPPPKTLPAARLRSAPGSVLPPGGRETLGAARRVSRDAKVWLFDLDNTLHDASARIFPHINRSMREYIERHLGVDEQEATRLRQHYWSRYGATLLGLVRHHGTDPRHFLWHTHQFADLSRLVSFPRPIDAVLKRLPGRKIVFSNAPAHYTEAVLDILGIRRHFAAVWPIERLRFQPKPLPQAFRRLLAGERLRPSDCIFVDDTPANLRAGKALGMKTVLISRLLRVPAFVDVRLESVVDLPRVIGRL